MIYKNQRLEIYLYVLERIMHSYYSFKGLKGVSFDISINRNYYYFSVLKSIRNCKPFKYS